MRDVLNGMYGKVETCTWNITQGSQVKLMMLTNVPQPIKLRLKSLRAQKTEGQLGAKVVTECKRS